MRVLRQLSVLGLLGCGSPCTYDSTTGSVEVTTIEARGSRCSRVFFTWKTGKPSTTPLDDHYDVATPCITDKTIHVGSTFSVTRQDLKSSTSADCALQLYSVSDPQLATCACL